LTGAKLFIVPTPIGNLGDITYRAIDVLSKVDLILAEDTRKTGVLLKHYQISKPVKSYHNFNEHRQLAAIIEQLKSGRNIALVSDAGTPGISDPGYLLIRECLNEKIEIEALPGPTAFIPALLKSGFPCNRFIFEGFLPHKKGRISRIEALKSEHRTIIFYESPHRLIKTLEQFSKIFGIDRAISISREISKMYEETFTGTVSEALDYFRSQTIKGEFVIVVSGNQKKSDGNAPE
jgi:16S rRNA (cytidine1402-2'-O)-methyltransferase